MSRPLFPRPSFGDADTHTTASTSKSRKISTACSTCKTRKTKVSLHHTFRLCSSTDQVQKCSGTAPCDACATRGSNCVYDQASDQRRKIANQKNLQDLVEAQTNLERHRQLLGGILSTIRVGSPQATSDLLETIRSGVDLSQLAAHVRNARRADPAIDQAFSSIVFIVDGPEELPSPEQLLQSMQGNTYAALESSSDGTEIAANPMAFLDGQMPQDSYEQRS